MTSRCTVLTLDDSTEQLRALEGPRTTVTSAEASKRTGNIKFDYILRGTVSIPFISDLPRASQPSDAGWVALPRCLLGSTRRLDTRLSPRLPARAFEPQLTWSRDHHHLDPFLYFPLKVGHVGQERRRLPPALRHRCPSKLHRAQVRAVERTGLAGCVGRGGSKVVVIVRNQDAPPRRSSVVAGRAVVKLQGAPPRNIQWKQYDCCLKI